MNLDVSPSGWSRAASGQPQPVRGGCLRALLELLTVWRAAFCAASLVVIIEMLVRHVFGPVVANLIVLAAGVDLRDLALRFLELGPL